MTQPARRFQLRGLRHEAGGAKAFGAEGAHERESRGGEQRLLPHGRRVGDICHGYEAIGCGLVLSEEDVEWDVGFEG